MTTAPAAHRTRARVLVVQHERGAPAGLVGRWLTERRVDLDVVHPYAGDEVPASMREHDGLLVLGGGMGAHDDDVAPWLRDVRALLARCAGDDVPTWGICLGGQLLAAAAGGRVEIGDLPELGVLALDLTDDGRRDALVATLPDRAEVAQFHRDGISALPAGAVVLARSEAYPVQAFRLGTRVWGVQFHPEVDADLVEPWLVEEPDLADATGRSPDDVVRELRAKQPLLQRTWRPFAHAWADQVVTYREEGRR